MEIALQEFTHTFIAQFVKYIYIYTYKNITCIFIHRHFIIYLLKLIQVIDNYWFWSEEFLIP